MHLHGFLQSVVRALGRLVLWPPSELRQHTHHHITLHQITAPSQPRCPQPTTYTHTLAPHRTAVSCTSLCCASLWHQCINVSGPVAGAKLLAPLCLHPRLNIQHRTSTTNAPPPTLQRQNGTHNTAHTAHRTHSTQRPNGTQRFAQQPTQGTPRTNSHSIQHTPTRTAHSTCQLVQHIAQTPQLAQTPHATALQQPNSTAAACTAQTPMQQTHTATHTATHIEHSTRQLAWHIAHTSPHTTHTNAQHRGRIAQRWPWAVAASP